MDNLPKDNQTSDAFSFTGKYPEEKPPVTNPPPTAAEPFTAAPPINNAPDTFTASTSLPEASVNPPVVQPQPAEPAVNPFVVGEPPVSSGTKSSGGALKRILMFLLLLAVLGTIGYFAYQFIGKLFTQNQTVTLTYWGLWENEQIIQPLLDQYKKSHPGINISYTKNTIKQYRERLQSAIDRGEGPDIFRFHNTWVPMLKDSLAPADKTGYGAQEFQQTFYPVATKDLVINGSVYGIPLMIDGLGLYYNEDLLRSAGVTPPTTWEQLTTVVKAVKTPRNNTEITTAGIALGTTNNIEHYSDILALMMLQDGADLKNPTSKEAQYALSFYHMFAEPASEYYSWNDTMDNSILAFANGRVAMIFAPSWEVFNIRDINPNLKYQIIPVPQLSGSNLTWASYWAEGVSKKSKHTAQAWEFLQFLSSKESLITLYTEVSKTRPFGEPYSRVDLAQTVMNDQYIGAYIRQAPTAQSFFLSSRTFDNGINDRMIKYLEDGVNRLNQGVSVQASLETVAQGFSQVLSSFNSTSTAP